MWVGSYLLCEITSEDSRFPQRFCSKTMILLAAKLIKILKISADIKTYSNKKVFTHLKKLFKKNRNMFYRQLKK